MTQSAQLIPVTMPLTASPGDLLILFEGKCIGVCHPTERLKQVPVKRTRNKRAPKAESVLKYFKPGKPLTTMQLNALAGADRGQRQRNSAYVRILARRGVLRPTSTNRRPAFELVQQEPSA